MNSFEIPLSSPDVRPEDLQLVQKVLQSGKLSIGPVIEEFEEAFADRLGVKHAIAVSSGTAALHLAVQLSGIGEGDEVIVSPFSFVASANAVLYEKATPVFVDIEEERLGIDATLVQASITSKTRAILPTHVFGRACAIDKLSEIATTKGLKLIEDNCESPGATIQVNGVNRPAGSFGQFVAYGFYPNKLLTTGEGGMLTTDDPELAAMARSLRNQGRGADNGIHMIHDRLGYNYRMSEIQAALGLSQLERLDDSISLRQKVVARYVELLRDEERVKLPHQSTQETHTWFVFAVRVQEKVRDLVIKYLASKGIQAKAYFFPCIHLQPYYRKMFGFKEGDFPIAEKVSREIIALPIFNQMKESQIERVVETLKEALDQYD